ncbi:FUSC family protein [Paraburkholderia nemoris]|uniref:Multidrug resistance protein MdtO n=1 Tax=Paraburkholderia nemoris TaxID=2793076 RepID=A0ABN7LEH9_9BURK|nr:MULTISPECIES: FUSC family protein [Paraburkholderia]MBK3741291.1 FUSC family protein [Paraburkholderia aspalathi]MBK3811109.1 FUSC family protein [Paraburkholderia aspalathi]CAE6746339.1 Multidrug resistance protein MdtO [Paraburkholderia nemoris]CAE6749293.1 Multidrug resistance protein MdtO [Paraburkholderia nemoris]CAE6802012.1 Multidrug resistance protein MdtO [Paraburkholderia nemoris]
MSGLDGVGRHLAWPRPLGQLAGFLRAELSAFPGRANLTMRSVLGCAIVLVVSMTLRVPEVALSLIAVFFVTQSNIVLTRLVALLAVIGTTCAIACIIGVFKLTFDYPLLRIVVASAIFFCSAYLMRAVAKLGLVFFLVSLIVIYAQTFADRTDNAEALVRACLWVWVAVNYAVVLSLIINTLFLPAEPEQQLRAAMQRQLATARARLAIMIDANAPAVRIGSLDLERGALALQKLLRFSTMRHHYSEADASAWLACVTVVSRIFEAAAVLPEHAVAHDAGQIDAIRVVQDELVSLEHAIGDNLQWRHWGASREAPVLTSIPALDAMQRALNVFSEATRGAVAPPPEDAAAGSAAAKEAKAEQATKAAAPPAQPEPDIFANPRYARFALRTLFSVLICYVFYNAVNWPGIHTIMLTCLVVALPSLGASSRQGVLRLTGAMIGSALALFMVAFVIPQLESVTGLLLMSLPVIALGAWVAAGSERISYAGIQIMFTFALALLESFSPPSDLTEIRDRIVGIILGVGVATFIQMSMWPERESDGLRAQLTSILRKIAALARIEAKAVQSGPRATDSAAVVEAWTMVGDCEMALARVALEPDWREGETSRITLLSQTVLAQSRAMLVALEAFHHEAMINASASAPLERAAKFQSDVADALERYASQLAAEPSAAMTPARLDPSGLRAALPPAGAAETASGQALERLAQRIDAALAGLPRWLPDERVSGEFASAG